MGEQDFAQLRLDMLVTTEKYIYVFEFKLGDKADKAIEQINSKNYALQWRSDGRKIFKIGVAFSAAQRGISEFIIEE